MELKERWKLGFELHPKNILLYLDIAVRAAASKHIDKRTLKIAYFLGYCLVGPLHET
jgi:hypothetical protein